MTELELNSETELGNAVLVDVLSGIRIVEVITETVLQLLEFTAGAIVVLSSFPLLTVVDNPVPLSSAEVILLNSEVSVVLTGYIVEGAVFSSVPFLPVSLF